MNKDLKNIWIQELRSGKYTKCIGRLKSGEAFSVTGLLCNLVDDSRWLDKDRYAVSSDAAHGVAYNPPDDIYKLAKLSGNQVAELEYQNDNNFSFAEIADYIEENL